jgi:hypothetical protein
MQETVNEAQNLPQWVEGLRWIIVAILISSATAGPYIFSSWIRNRKPIEPLPNTPTTPMAVIGGALADRDAVFELASVINRLCDILEARYMIEKEENEEDKMRRKMRELLEELKGKEKL